MSKIDWNVYPIGIILKSKRNSYILRTKKIVSDSEPDSEKIFSDSLITITGFYNRKGMVIGYEINYKNSPTILEDSFYLVLNYVNKGDYPKELMYPKLYSKDSSINLVKFGKSLANRMYIFIYRRK